MIMKRNLQIVLALALAIGWYGFSAKHNMAEEVPKFVGEIERVAPEFDKLVPADAKMEVLSHGHEWTEGPIWMRCRGHLLFSDIPRNAIYRYRDGKTDVFMKPSGYTGEKSFNGHEPGTNGLTRDSQRRLVMCCHGDRCVTRIEKDGSRTVLVDRYQGKQLNSPNDLAYHKNGDLYFTDPPYGLPKDPVNTLGFCGVYRLSKDGQLTLLCDQMSRPNGIAFSPDYKTLYVAQSDPKAAIWNSFPVKEDGTLGAPKLLFDATKWVGSRPGLPDGLKVDVQGNLWATGPGGVLVLNPAGKYLGRLNTGERTANCAFGEDGKTLFICADMYLLRIPLTTKGAGF
jgi:gluconolactonase